MIFLLRSDVYLYLGVNSQTTYVEPAQLPIVIPRERVARPPTPPQASTSTDPAWAPDSLDNPVTDWTIEPPSFEGASWLVEPDAYHQMNANVSFRIGVRRGKGGRTTGWTCPASQKLPTMPDLAPGQVLVEVMAKKKHFKDIFKASDLITIHPTKQDLSSNVWLLKAQQGHRFGALKEFDTEGLLTAADEDLYQRGSHAAMDKYKQVMCIVIVPGGEITVRNDNLVKFTVNTK